MQRIIHRLCDGTQILLAVALLSSLIFHNRDVGVRAMGCVCCRMEELMQHAACWVVWPTSKRTCTARTTILLL